MQPIFVSSFLTTNECEQSKATAKIDVAAVDPESLKAWNLILENELQAEADKVEAA